MDTSTRYTVAAMSHVAVASCHRRRQRATTGSQRGDSLTTGRLLSVSDLAAYLGVKTAWIYNNHKAVGLPGRKVGGHLRFRLADVDRWIDRQEG